MLLVLLLFSLEISYGYRSSMCVRPNEHFSLCGWKCSPTCVNIKILSAGKQPLCKLSWECRVGCRCNAGYVRDEYSNSCVLVNDCPEGIKKRRSYEDAAYADAAASYIASSTPAPYTPSNPTVAAIFPNQPGSAIPLLFNCAPTVNTGHLTNQPSYRAVETKDNNVLSPLNDGDVLDLDSPISVLTMERRRRKRHDELKGITYYKVSEDYPETNPGNHHLVSADYPHPNMIRITPSSRYL